MILLVLKNDGAGMGLPVARQPLPVEALELSTIEQQALIAFI